MSEDIRQKILALRKEVMRHEELYRKKNNPEITDFEFDQMVDQLRDLEREYPEFAGSDLGIGDDQAEGFQQRDHRQPMLSLDNTYDEKEFRAFGDRLFKILGDPKMDFVVEPGEKSTHVLNAVSPAWTSSLAVGEYVVNRIHTDGLNESVKG